MSKRGRPKSSEPIREVQYRLRITTEEHSFLKNLSESSGLSISNLIRHGALGVYENAIHRGIYNCITYDEKRMRDVLIRSQPKSRNDSGKNTTDTE